MNARLPGSIADNATALIEERARAEHPFSPYERKRLDMCAQIAAGMLANPQTYAMRDWPGEVARQSLRVTDKILTCWITGGC